MRKMEETRCPSVVRYIAYRRFLHDQVHRIYMEFCPHGDLKRLYRRYRKFRFVCRLVRNGFEVLNLSRLYMPEPFLWDVFRHLVETAVAMRYGPTDGGWAGHEIVHRDIKPGNSPTPDFFPTIVNANCDPVFLDKEDMKDGIPFYPLSKLGDWGLARETHADDPDNPTRLRQAGTPGYKAPVSAIFASARTANVERYQEQKEPPLLVPESHPAPILVHTNVWAIGATMFELMTLHRVHRFLLKTQGNIIDEEGIQPIETNRKPPYSSHLSQLIQDCLKPTPVDRPDVMELRIKISTHRDAIIKLVREREGAERAEPMDDERLYYVGNEIKWAEPGAWRPHERDRGSKESEDGFADPDLSPIRYPVFEDSEE